MEKLMKVRTLESTREEWKLTGVIVLGPNIPNKFLVSKETVVLRRWEISKQKFCFIKRVDKGWITTVKDLESRRLER